MKSRRTKIELQLHYDGGPVKLPTGRRVAESQASIAHLLQQYGHSFKGSINVYKTTNNLGSNGFIVVDNGTVLASAYSMLSITLYQLSALERMLSLANTRSEIIALTDDEILDVLQTYPRAALVEACPEPAGRSPIAPGEAPAASRIAQLAGQAVAASAVVSVPSQESSVSGVVVSVPSQESSVSGVVVSVPSQESSVSGVPPAAAEPGPALNRLSGYEGIISSFTTLPGVIGTALVADGFPVYQHGKDVDFEHVAAATEDMVRAGTRIATELQLGNTGQIILETPDYKVIIAPINDMFLCVLTITDTNLGLIRLNIRNVQRSEVK